MVENGLFASLSDYKLNFYYFLSNLKMTSNLITWKTILCVTYNRQTDNQEKSMHDKWTWYVITYTGTFSGHQYLVNCVGNKETALRTIDKPQYKDNFPLLLTHLKST